MGEIKELHRLQEVQAVVAAVRTRPLLDLLEPRAPAGDARVLEMLAETVLLARAQLAAVAAPVL
jgi:hypothetical protein